MREDLRELLEAAEDDLDTARKLYELGKYRYTCFFAQQAVEKYLKAPPIQNKQVSLYTLNN